MPGSSLIGNLAVTLGLNTAAFERGATKAEARAKALQGRLSGIGSSVKGLAAGLGIGLGIGAITSLTRSAFDMASALDESAQKMGVSVEALQRLNLAATQSGISQESLAGAMAKLNKNMGLLQEGSKPAVDAFAKLGLTADDLKGKLPEQALGIIADRLNKLPSVQERVAVGAQLMGRGFSELLPLINLGSAGLDKYSQISQKNGEITTEEAKRLDELSDSWDRLKVRVGVFTAKVIATMAEFVDKSDAFLAGWYRWRDQTIAAAEQMASGAVKAISNMVTGIAQAISGRLNAVWDGVKSKVDSVTQKFRDMYDAVVGHSYVPDMVQGIADEFSRLREIMVDPAISASQKVAAAFQGLANVAGQVFGRKAGGIFGAIAQAVSVIAPLVGGVRIAGPNLSSPMPVSLGSPQPLARVPGFARGGGGVFGGFPGMDKNILSLNGRPMARVSRGERFIVANKAANQPYFDLRGAVMTQDLLRQMNQIGEVSTGRGAILGAAGAEQRGAQRARRMIP
jgi:hypothetical protein